MNLPKIGLGYNRTGFWITCILLIVLSAVTVVFYKGQTYTFVHVATSNTSKYDGNEFELQAKNPPKHKIICMIITLISTWENRGRAVRNTWARRCYKAIFFYTKHGNCSESSICKEPNAVGLNVPDGRGHLTAKTLAALNYSYTNYASEADYFLKADDDTYVVMENLHRIISRFNSSSLLYLGRKIQNLTPRGYNSGGAGYIIGKEAVRRLLQNGTSLFPKDCPTDGGIEDYDIGHCLSKLGVYPEDELDETGRLIFHSDNPLFVLQGREVAGYYYININDAEFGKKETKKSRGFMLSQWTATMHYVTPPEMYMYEFLLYKLKRDYIYDTNDSSVV